MTTAQAQTTGLQNKANINERVLAPKLWVNRITRRQEFRKAFVPLLKERDQILSDIGYQRYDILRAMRLPLRDDAMSYIEIKRLTRPTAESQTRLTR
jgi:hypothetical protein